MAGEESNSQSPNLEKIILCPDYNAPASIWLDGSEIMSHDDGAIANFLLAMVNGLFC